MGFLFGDGGKKAAKIQAAATTKAADMQATNDAFSAQAAAQTQQTMAAQAKASTAASELLSKPMAAVDVNLAPDTPDASVDPNTGRRRTARSQFMTTPASSGINL